MSGPCCGQPFDDSPDRTPVPRDDEQGPSSSASSSMSASSTSDSVPLPETRRIRRGYNLEDHICTSADEHVQAAHNNTPSAMSRSELLGKATSLYEYLWDQNLEILLQMIAQEMQRLSLQATDNNAAMLLQISADLAKPYIIPGLDSDILLAPRWREWLRIFYLEAHMAGQVADLEAHMTDQVVDHPDGQDETNTNNLAESSRFSTTWHAASSNHDDEDFSLMGGRPERKPTNEGQRDAPQRRDDDRRIRSSSHRRDRDTSSRAASHPWRSRSPRPTRPEPSYPPPQADRAQQHAPVCTSSTRRLGVTSAAEEAMSLNRHAWRSMLGISDEGPGTDLDRHLPLPLPRDVTENILETVHNMPVEHRVAFLAGLLRFLLEVAQQVSEILVTNKADADPNDFPDQDNLMMVQLDATLITKARVQFQAVQHSLDSTPQRQMWRARQLRRLLQSHYVGLQNDIHGEVLELDAMLLTYEAECGGEAVSNLNDEDRQWTDTWWRQLHKTLSAMDEAAGLRTRPAHPASTSVDGRSLGIDLDTPPPLLDDRDARDLQLQEQQECETEGLIRLFDEYQAEQAARQAQAEDNASLQSALNAPPLKCPRLQINVTVSTAGSSSSSTTRLHVPAPWDNEGVTVQLQMKVIQSTIKQDPDEDGDGTTLMQTSGSPRSTTTARLTARLRSLLYAVHPGLRTQVIARVRSLLQRRLRLHLSHARTLLDLILSGIMGDQATTPDNMTCPGSLDELANFIVENLQAMETSPTDSDLHERDLLANMTTALTNNDSHFVQPQRGTSSTRTTLPLVPMAGTTPTALAADIRDRLMNELMEGVIEDREQILREIAKHTVSHLQTQAFRLQTLLALLSDLLPQPNSPSITSSQINGGTSKFAQIITTMDQYVAPVPENTFQYMPFGVAEVIQLLPALEGLTIDTMAFFENGGFLDDDIPSSDEGEPESAGQDRDSRRGLGCYHADHTTTDGRKHQDTQTTRPPSGNVSTSSATTIRRPFLQNTRASPPRPMRGTARHAEREAQEAVQQAEEAVLEEPGTVREDDHEPGTESTSSIGVGNHTMQGGTGELTSPCGEYDNSDSSPPSRLGAIPSRSSSTTTTTRATGSSKGLKMVKKKKKRTKGTTSVGRPLGYPQDEDGDSHDKDRDPTLWRFITTESRH